MLHRTEERGTTFQRPFFFLKKNEVPHLPVATHLSPRVFHPTDHFRSNGSPLPPPPNFPPIRFQRSLRFIINSFHILNALSKNVQGVPVLSRYRKLVLQLCQLQNASDLIMDHSETAILNFSKKSLDKSSWFTNFYFTLALCGFLN